MQHLFDPNNLFWRIIAKGVDFVGLSVIWAFCCLPIVTIGPACSALYYTVVKTFRRHEDGAFGMFFHAFRDNLRTGIPVTLICLPLFVLMAYGYTVMHANSGTTFGAAVFVGYFVLLILPVGMLCWLFPLMGRFSMKKRELFKTAFSMAIAHLPSTVVIALLTTELAIWTIEKWSPVFITPVGCVLISSFFMEKAFEKHLSAEERAALRGVTVEELEAQEKAEFAARHPIKAHKQAQKEMEDALKRSEEENKED